MTVKSDKETSILEDVNKLGELIAERDRIEREFKRFQEKLKEHGLFKHKRKDKSDCKDITKYYRPM